MKAIVYLPKGRKYWRVIYRFNNRRYSVQHSVYGEKLFDKSQGDEVANRIADEIRNNRHHPEEWGKGNILKFGRAWEIFDEQSPCSQVTKEYRNQVCRDYLLPYFEKFSLRQIEEEDIRDFFSTLPDHFSLGYKLKIIGVLRTFLNFTHVTWVKRLRYPKITIPQKSIPRLTQEDQFKVLGLVENWHKPIVHFCLTYGCRPSEACNLRKQDINWQERTFTFRERKNKKDHELPILPEIEKYLVGGTEQNGIERNALRREQDGRSLSILTNTKPPTKVSNLIYVFCTRWGRQYSRQEVTKAWRIANRKAHEKFGVPITLFKNATHHSLVCRMRNEGRNFEDIGSITGNSPRVLERSYAETDMKRKLEILSGKAEMLREAR